MTEHYTPGHQDKISMRWFTTDMFSLVCDFGCGALYGYSNDSSIAGYLFSTGDRKVELWIEMDILNANSSLMITTYLIGTSIVTILPSGAVQVMD